MDLESIKQLSSHRLLSGIWKASFRPNYSPATLRRNFEMIAGISKEKLIKKYPQLTLTEWHGNGVAMEIIETIPNPTKTLVYLHGGGHIMGSQSTYRQNLLRIAYRSQCRVVMVDYPLSPENPYPASLEAGVTAFLACADRWKEGAVLLGGDSAGGGLALSVLMALRDRELQLPKAALLFSPWTDLVGTGESFLTNRKKDCCVTEVHLKTWAPYYYGHHDASDPLISPVYGDFKGLPPLFMNVGGQELLLDDSRRVAEKAKLAGVRVQLEIYESMQHVWFFSLPWLKQSKQAVQQIAQYIQAL